MRYPSPKAFLLPRERSAYDKGCRDRSKGLPIYTCKYRDLPRQAAYRNGWSDMGDMLTSHRRREWSEIVGKVHFTTAKERARRHLQRKMK